MGHGTKKVENHCFALRWKQTMQILSNMKCGNQGLKKCKFPGKLIEIFRGPQVEDYRPFMMSRKVFLFLNTLHLRVHHCLHIDQLGSIHIQRVNSLIGAVHTLPLGSQKRDTVGVQTRWEQRIFAAKQILAPNPCLRKSGSILTANRKCWREIQFVLCGQSFM